MNDSWCVYLYWTNEGQEGNSQINEWKSWMSCLNSRLKIEDKDNQIKKKNAPNEVILLKLTWFLKKKKKKWIPHLDINECEEVGLVWMNKY